MPGTIQVTVLEFKGVSSSGKPSAKSIQVSLGKRSYQTWDKGDFSFPLTKLREDLVVSLLDAGGNVIAQTDIKTMQIIEKGSSWDEVFSLNGGGHVHLKLLFVLNEEERNRIREMRESALKKKKLEKANKPALESADSSPGHEKNVSADFPETDSRNVISDQVEASQAGLFSVSAASFNPTQYYDEVVQRSESVAPKVPIIEKKSQNPPKKLAAKSNVMKMISAFENNQLQEVKTMKKAQSSPSLSNLKKLRHEPVFQEMEDEAVDKPKIDGKKISEKLKDQSPVNPNHSSTSKAVTESKAREKDLNVEKESSSLLPSSSTSSSSKLREKDLHVENESSSLLPSSSSSSSPMSSSSMVETKRQSDSESASCSGNAIEEGQGRRRTSLKGSTAIDHEAKLLGYYKEKYRSSSRFYGTLIFEDDHASPLCITSAGKQARKVLGEAENVRAKRISKEAEKAEQNDYNIVKMSEGGRRSGDDGSSNGLIGQVIKVAVILGFGLLVVLTRQREPRKRKGAEKDHLYAIKDYATLMREEH